MKIQHLGHSSFKISTGSVTVVTDPFDPQKVGLPYPKIQADLVLSSHDHFDHRYLEAVTGEPFVINAPGEYEVKDVKVRSSGTLNPTSTAADNAPIAIKSLHTNTLSLCHLG